MCCYVLAGCQITKHPCSHPEKFNGNITLSVSVVGTVQSYQWKKDEKEIIDGKLYSGTKKKNLKIKNLHQEQTGKYACILLGGDGMKVSTESTNVTLGKGCS